MEGAMQLLSAMHTR